MRKPVRPSRSLLRFTAAALILAGLPLSECSEPESAPSASCPDDSTQIVLTSPMGGETFAVGDSLRVRWKLCNSGPDEINAVDMLITPDDGATWCYMRVNSLPIGDKRFGDYAWKIPDSVELQGEKFGMKNNSKCRVRVEQYSTGDPRQRSTSGLFTVR